MPYPILEAIIVSGEASVADDVLPPGARVASATTLVAAHVRVGAAPDADGLTVRVKRNGAEILSVTVTTAATSASATGLGIDLDEGDVLTFDVVAIGAPTAGSDVAVQLIGD